MSPEQIEAKARYEAASRALGEASLAVTKARLLYDAASREFLAAEAAARKLGAI